MRVKGTGRSGSRGNCGQDIMYLKSKFKIKNRHEEMHDVWAMYKKPIKLTDSKIFDRVRETI